MTTWSAQETNGTLRRNEQLGYGYDSADNIHFRTNDALVQTFNVDAFNELSTITRTGNLTLSGVTPAPATNITANGLTAQKYNDFTFARTNLALADGNNTFTNIATNLYGVGSTNSFTVNLPATVTLQYDTNGNLTSDGSRHFVYDAENQLTNVYVTNLWKTEFVYDGMRRRRISRDYTWSGSAWARTNETRYVYDGMLPIQERDSNNAVVVTYTRGLDLSGSRQGAGGISGLLARTDANGSTFYHSDGAGNITALIDGNQNIVARYEYDLFGKLIGKWGALADANHYRFSSKEVHSLSGLYSYGFRFYDPSFQRWLNRDPIAEAGGINLYRINNNTPLNLIDSYGLLGLSDFNPTLLIDGEAWNQLAWQPVYRFFAGDLDNLKFDPNSKANVDNNGGLGITGYHDESGNRIRAGTLVGTTVGSAAVQVVVMAAGGTEEEEAVLWGKEMQEYYRGSKLARNCEMAGKPVLKSIERAHHIVAETAEAAAPARSKLRQLGIDIDDAVNGVGLPTEFHEGLHTEDYYRRINDASKTWKSKQDAINGLNQIANSLIQQSQGK